MTANTKNGVVNSVIDLYHHVFEEQRDKRMDSWLFVATPLQMAVISLSYYCFVNYAGKKFMDNRKPYDLTQLIICYNMFQTVINGLLHLNSLRLLYEYDRPLSCINLCYDYNDYFTKQLVMCTYLYYLIKMSELTDTVFMVLRKNYRQVTFLHVYHHLLMAIGSWTITRYFPGGHTVIFGILNTGVHTVMYFYYFLSAKHPDHKKSLWWKKHLTQLQIIQFLIIFCHFGIAFVSPTCQYPKWLLTILMFQSALMTVMFSKFYCSAYIVPKKVEVETKVLHKKVE